MLGLIYFTQGTKKEIELRLLTSGLHSAIGDGMEALMVRDVGLLGPVIPALGRLRKEGPKFQDSLDYKTRPYLEKNKTTTKHLAHSSCFLSVY
jgi:hypothetical protein